MNTKAALAASVGVLIGIGVIAALYLTLREAVETPPQPETEEVEERVGEEPKSMAIVKEGAVVTIETTEDNTRHDILVEGEAVATISTTNGPTNAWVWRQTAGNAYIAVNPDGLGGYILYGGAHKLYRLDLETNTLTLLGVNQGGYATDISTDESMMAWIHQDSEGRWTINVTDLASGSVRQFEIDAKFDEAGNAMFSPDGTKLAFAASTKWTVEEHFVFIIDLKAGAITQVNTDPLTGTPPLPVWTNNAEVSY